MANREYCYLYLTCESAEEADRISQALLEKHLIVCAKSTPVKAKYWWEGKITAGTEVLLAMESMLELFDKVEQEVAKLHSYDTFVLEAVPVAVVSAKAKQWMEENIQSNITEE